MHTAESAQEMRRDFADDWARTQGFTAPDIDYPLPSPNLIIDDPDPLVEIIETVARISDLRPEELMSQRQYPWICRYRWMVYLVASEMLDRGPSRLGRDLGKHHATVCHALKRARHARDTDQVWCERYLRVLNDLG